MEELNWVKNLSLGFSCQKDKISLRHLSPGKETALSMKEDRARNVGKVPFFVPLLLFITQSFLLDSVFFSTKYILWGLFQEAFISGKQGLISHSSFKFMFCINLHTLS